MKPTFSGKIYDSLYHRICLFFLFLLLSISVFAEISLDFSHERGYYEAPIQLTITSSHPSATIRYTTNKSKPSFSNGNIYSGAITISDMTNLRVFAYTSNESTKVIAHSYIFIPTAIAQGDSYIINSGTYSGLMKSSFEALPVISLTSSQIAPGNFSIPNETEVSAEMFFPDKSRKGFMINCGIETWGGSSSNPKKHYRLEFKSMYGDSKLRYDVFEKDNYDQTDYEIKPVAKFDKLLLRSGSQDGLNGEYSNENLAQYVRNRVQFDTQIAMGYPAPHGRFVHAFINGVYNGMYHLMERPDEAFFEGYYGNEKEDYEIFKSNDYLNGPFGLFSSLNNYVQNLNTQAAIDNANQYIDLDQTAAFLMLMCYGSGFDWAQSHNSLGGGHITPGTVPYKFILWDVDFTYGNGGSWHPYYGGDPDYFRVPFGQDGQVPDDLSSQLEFRYMMADHMDCECFDDGLLTAGTIDSLYMDRINQVRMALIAESAIWGNDPFSYGSNHVSVSNWDVFDEFDTETNRLRNHHFPVRTDNMVAYWKGEGIYPITESVAFNKKGGIVNQGFVVTLSNPGNSGSIYYTLDGTDPRDVRGYIRSTAFQYNGPITLPNGVVTVKARVRNNYYNRTSINRWSAMCPATFYVEQDYSAIVINEIMYAPSTHCTQKAIDSTETDFIELHNTSNTAVNLQGSYFDSGIDFRFTESAIIPPGGFLVLVEDEQVFFLKHAYTPYGQYSGGLNDNGEYLSLLNPEQQVIDSLAYNDNSPWDLDPDEGATSLELLSPSFDNADPISWFRSDNDCGTPGAANSRICSAAATPIVINEINYNSDNQNFDPGNWVELYNPNPVAVDLTDWELYDNYALYTIPAGTSIGPGEFLVVVESTPDFTSSFPATSNFIGDLPYALNNTQERISLFDPNKCLSDYVAYKDQMPWDSMPDGYGPTLSLVNTGLDNALPSSWESSGNINAPYGTPGRANEPCPVFNIGIPDTICILDTVTFTVDIIPNSSVEWHFPNAAPQTSTNGSVTVAFNAVGAQTIQLITHYFECIDTINIVINVLGCNGPPTTQSDYYTVNEDAILNGDVAINDSEPNGEPILFSLNTTTTNGLLNFNSNNGTFNYIPGPDYNGSDVFEYEACDTSSHCVLEQVYITVAPVNDMVIANFDLYSTNAVTQMQGDVSTNDFDIDGDQLTCLMIQLPTGGNPLFNTNGAFYYTPFPGFNGLDSFVYKVCDGGTPEYCDTAIVYIDVIPECITVNLAAFLEGPYDPAIDAMKSSLNGSRKLLPGMDNNPISGQPYNIAPWSYNGQEGLNWTGTDYSADAVDWVLVSFRSTLQKTSEAHRLAGLLMEDGSISFPGDCPNVVDLPGPAYYVVIEHRNHMGTMSPIPITINNKTIDFDFRVNDSYADGGIGQKLIPGSNKWVLHTGDGIQLPDAVSYDINGKDKNGWVQENGEFGKYMFFDFDLNGDVNGDDKNLWSINNGAFSSVPK